MLDTLSKQGSSLLIAEQQNTWGNKMKTAECH